MNDDKKLKIALWASVIATVITGLILVATIVRSVQRTTDAIKYDLDCTTTSIYKPLEECKL